MKSLLEPSRIALNEEQKERSNKVWLAATVFLEVLTETAKPSQELTAACRALEECVMWHTKAVSNESKSPQG